MNYELGLFELDTGQVQWRKDVSDGLQTSLAIKAGLLVMTTTEGQVVACDAYSGQQRWSYTTPSPFFASPAVTPDSVFAIDAKGVLHSVRLADGTAQWKLDLGAEIAIESTETAFSSPVVQQDRIYLTASMTAPGTSDSITRLVCVGEP